MLQKVLAKFEHPNYFDSPIKLFSDLIKFVNISTKLFLPCICMAKERENSSPVKCSKTDLFFISFRSTFHWMNFRSKSDYNRDIIIS